MMTAEAAEPLLPVKHRKIALVQQDGHTMDFDNQRELSRYLGISAEKIEEAIKTGHKVDLDGICVYITHGNEIRTEAAITKMGGSLMLSANPIQITFANGEKQAFPSMKSAADLLKLPIGRVVELVKTGDIYRGATFRSAKK